MADADAPEPHPSGLPPRLLAAPPWILGHRGAPLESPENTLASLERALGHGLDGVEYDLQRSREGEAILLHDTTFERTAGDRRPAEELSLSEMAHLEVGGWFQKRFAGEPVPLLRDALALGRTAAGEWALHMIELKRTDLVDRVLEVLREEAPTLPVRIASFHREVCLAARDAGLPSMLLAVRWRPEDAKWLAQHGIEAYGLGPGGWTDAPERDGSHLERWGWSVDRPEHLLEACRRPLFGFNTNEPRRALAARALTHLCPTDRGPWPVEAPTLPMDAGPGDGAPEWFGRFRPRAAVRNPFPFDVGIEVQLEVRQGAFECSGLPEPFVLGPFARREFGFALSGGGYSPGPDPLLVVRMHLSEGPGREGARLSLDAPLERVRTLQLRNTSVRVHCLAEAPSAAGATLSLRRRGTELVAEAEHAPGLSDVRVAVWLDGELHLGARGLAARLPADFDRRAGGVPFSCGYLGLRDGRSTWLRWAGGLPPGVHSGSPGRLVPSPRA